MLEQFFIKLLEISIQTSFFILAVTCMRLIKRLPKQFICFMWALAALRLMIPIQITTEFSMVPDVRHVESLAQISLPQKETITAIGQPLEFEPLTEVTVSTDVGSSINTSVPSEFTAAGVDATAPLTLTELLSRIWLVGMFLLMGYGLFSYLRLKLRLREAVYDHDNIWLCDITESPFVLGYIKPRIYIPFTIPKEQLPYIIAHERAHISHFDHLGKLLGFMLLCLYWFNPFIWVGYILYCKDLELSCDERVIKTLGMEEKKHYSEALLMCSVSTTTILQSPLSFSEIALKERIINILHYKKPGLWCILLAILLSITASVCFLTESEPAKTDHDIFLHEITTELLDKVTAEYIPENGFHELPEQPGPDAYVLIQTYGTENLQFYGLVDGSAMILRDGDTLYSVQEIPWPQRRSESPNEVAAITIYKEDYDKDNTPEYAISSDENGIYSKSVIVLEAKDDILQPFTFTREDIASQLQRISFEYADEEELIYIYMDSEEPAVTLDVTWVNEMYGQTNTRLSFDTTTYISIIPTYSEDPWMLYTSAAYLPQDDTYPFHQVAVSFSAPVTYSSDGTFQIGEFTLDYTNTKPSYLEQCTEELEAFPGQAKELDNEQLITTVTVNDRYCVMTTDPATGKQVYVWQGQTTKDYPLEYVDDQIREVPAEAVTRNIVSKYCFGGDLLAQVERLHPYGTKQYIIRDNGTINVNIAYEENDHVEFQYLTFQIREENHDYVTLTDYGYGCYLVQLTDTDALKAFRRFYTGDEHLLPKQTSQLPWDWLLALNNEENDAPNIKQSSLPEYASPFDVMDLIYNNITDYYNGFIVSRKIMDGESFIEYHYQTPKDDISILTGPYGGEVLSATYNDTKIPLPDYPLCLFAGGAAGAYGTIYYMDETGDGKPELIFETGGGGTGIYHTDLYIYNPARKEQYFIDANVLDITSKLQVTLMEKSKEDGKLHFKLKYEDQIIEADGWCDIKKAEHAAMLKSDVTLEDANTYFHYTPDTTTDNISYNPQNGRFEAQIPIWIDNTVYSQYIGTLWVAFKWDAKAGEFVIDSDTVILLN